MKLFLCCFCLFLSINNPLYAQPVYGNDFALPNNSWFYGVANAYDGGVLIGGSFDNKPIWLRTTENSVQQSYNIQVPLSNNSNFNTLVYTSDSGHLAVGSRYYAKLDTGGTVEWSATNTSYYYRDVLETLNNEYILVGGKFGSPVNSPGVIKRLDTQGNLLWERNFSQNVRTAFNFVHELPNGDMIVIGRSYLTSVGYIQRRDAQGLSIWSKQINQTIEKAAPMHNGDYLLLLTSNELMRINSNGDSLSMQQFGSGNFTNIKAHPNDGFLLVGQDANGAGLLLHLDSSGTTVQWQQTFPTTLGDIELSDAVAQNNGGVMVVGDYSRGSSAPNFIQRGYWTKVDAQGQYLSVALLDNAPLAVQLFPNPTVSTLQLQLAQAPNQAFIAQLYNLQGQLLRTQRIQTINTTITVEDLPTGTYVLCVVDPHTQAQTSYQIVKQ